MSTMKKIRNNKNFSIIDIQNILNDLRYTKKIYDCHWATYNIHRGLISKINQG